MRPAILFLVCVLQFGTYFAYDAPASLNIQLQKYLGLEYAEWQFVLGQLFVMYSLPNTFLPFFGGKLTDRFGCRLVLLFFCLATLTGQVMVNIGLFVKEVKLVLLVLDAFTSKMGSIANAFLSPLIDRHFGIEVAIMGPTIAYPTPSNLSHLPYEFWIVCTTFILFTGPYYCFNNTALDFLVSKYYPNDTVSAGFAMSVPMTVSTSLLTVSGTTLSTSTHSKSIYLVFSFLAITAVHIFLGFTALSPIVPFIALGTAGAINLTLMYPFVNHVIRRHEARAVESVSMLGMAYGVCVCLQNVVLVVIPLCVAWILTNGQQDMRRWEHLELFFASLSVLGAAGALWLYRIEQMEID
ncbi:hypothetical protein BCR33DRAFT_717113 [Rhizoclosmatium globosum]|uniref:MFS general substrate transporter n=1 Tax=Rhizoclosmatium globosum TaxID=329046 RepID=A0A1Y2CAD6_9FUNG|nr:hypothetical protein BCR33DRAFT_717113 [Rhizoclosmatium globosum]|eukprot:ORY43989.1 hypothetical protein BCR33DRAFT_717113 [Rhizoclosmatium globosum]